MREILIVLFFVPLLAYSQPNGRFKSISADRIRINDTLVIEDNVGRDLITIYNDGRIVLSDTISFQYFLTSDILSSSDSKVVLIDVGRNLLLLIIGVMAFLALIVHIIINKPKP